MSVFSYIDAAMMTPSAALRCHLRFRRSITPVRTDIAAQQVAVGRSLKRVRVAERRRVAKRRRYTRHKTGKTIEHHGFFLERGLVCRLSGRRRRRCA